jgi:hypothetical protein
MIKKINLIPSLIAENKAAIEIFILQKFLYKPSNYQASLCSLKKLRGLSAPLRLDRFHCQRLMSLIDKNAKLSGVLVPRNDPEADQRQEAHSTTPPHHRLAYRLFPSLPDTQHQPSGTSPLQ